MQGIPITTDNIRSPSENMVAATAVLTSDSVLPFTDLTTLAEREYAYTNLEDEVGVDLTDCYGTSDTADVRVTRPPQCKFNPPPRRASAATTLPNTMMKHGLVHETMAELSAAQSIAPLPPLNNLPQWSRVNTLDKARYPKPFLKDRLQPLPDPTPGDEEAAPVAGSNSDMEIINNTNPVQRIEHLEKSLDFLRRQHQEVLANLHDEIDTLKRENKDLQFQIVMMQNSPQTPIASAKRERHKGSRERGGSSSGLTDEKGPPPMRMDLTDPHQDQQSQVSDDKVEEMKILFLEGGD
ncbi:hypothetical protein LSAT2_006449 [Lamellibrachia satsuma]|nr:hypothetical protein LSAT2_006449 [Lamellibrachia satsuma]